MAPTRPNRQKNDASLLELFLDLIWVAFLGGVVHKCVHIITESIHHHKSVDFFSLIFTILLMIFLILIWKILTFYNSRYEAQNYRNRFIIMFIMIGLLIFTSSIFIKIEHGSDNLNLFILLDVISMFIIFATLFYSFFSIIRVSKSRIYEKKLIFRSLMGIVTSFLIVITSFISMMICIKFIHNKEIITILKWFLLIGSLVVGAINWCFWDWSSRTSKIVVNIINTSEHHMKDRFGIIFIVFIGEIIIQIVNSSEIINDLTGNVSLTLELIFMIIICFLLMFFWWWIFEDTIKRPEISLNPKKRNAYSFLILLILISLLIHAIGFSILIRGFFENNHDHYIEKNLNFWGKILVAIGILIWSVGNVGMSFCLKKYIKDIKAVLTLIFRFLFLASFVITPIFWIMTFIEQINQITYILILFAIVFTSIISLILITPLIFQKSEDQLMKLVKKDEKHLAKLIRPLLDKELHTKYDLSFNSYSKFLNKS